MQGSESSRPAAKYNANRALFLMLLSAAYRPIRLSDSGKSLHRLRRSRFTN
jgi:hypothetical protein